MFSNASVEYHDGRTPLVEDPIAIVGLELERVPSLLVSLPPRIMEVRGGSFFSTATGTWVDIEPADILLLWYVG